MLRPAGFLTVALLLAIGAVLGYISVIAARRGEGVFVPAGYVALASLAGAVFLLRALLIKS
jgi:hypothetical protein